MNFSLLGENFNYSFTIVGFCQLLIVRSLSFPTSVLISDHLSSYQASPLPKPSAVIERLIHQLSAQVSWGKTDLS